MRMSWRALCWVRDRFLFFVGICEGGDEDEDAGGEVFRWGIIRVGA